MNIRKLPLLGILLALAIVGADIKLFQSIALDSFSAFLGALLLGPIEGASLAFVGHLVSAFLSGFPLTLPIHIIVAIMTSLAVYLFGVVFESLNKTTTAYILSIIVGYFSNVILSLEVLYPFIGNVVYMLFIPLSFASLFNIISASLIYSIIYNKI